MNKGKGKGHKGKQAQDVCYRCGQPGHIAKNCRVPVYNYGEAYTATTEQYDSTQQWYEDPNAYDNHWWNNMGYQGQDIHYQPQQLALPAPNATTATDNTPTIQIVSGVQHCEPIMVAHVQDGNAEQTTGTIDIMVDSGAATHVCPPWFAQEFPIQQLAAGNGPQLRTVTNDEIKLYGYKWVHMHNENRQPIVIPFYVCDVHQPIVSVSRLEEQGFKLTFDEEQRKITHPKGFSTTLIKQQSLYYLRTTVVPIPPNHTLQIHQTSEGTIAMIAPTMLTPQGPEPTLGGNNDYWTYNNEGYLVRVHRAKRKALFLPYKTCPVPTDRLENYRRTIVRRLDKNNEDLEEQFQDLSQHQQRRVLQGQVWTGETWFKLKAGTTVPTKTTTISTKKTENKQEASTRSTTFTPTHRFTTKAPATTQVIPTSKTTTTIPAPSTLDRTEDYWIQEGHMWKRVHIQTRKELYIPQQTQHGPDITKFKPDRASFMNPQDGTRMTRFDDQWTPQQQKLTDKTWTGSTNFEEKIAYNEEYITEDEDTQQSALPAKGIKAPQQPTEQERKEHNLTHLPYRSWCSICVESKGRANNHPQQKTSKLPVVQCDFAYIKGIHDKQVIPVLTAIDVETGMSMAIMVQDKQKQFTYLTQCLQTFLTECGRTQAILAPTILQSDQEEYLVSLLKTTARTIGSNITVRQSPAYSSQSQGSIERFHRTLFNRVRTLTAQLRNNYKLNNISINHPIMPWVIRHAAYLLNRYAIHNDGKTSYFRRWNKEHKTPLCEFGETIQYMIPHYKRMPKLESRFYKGTWLGKDTMTSESIIGIQGKIIRTRTIRRQIEPDKYDRQLMDIINAPPWTPVTPTEVLQPTMLIPANPASTKEQPTTETQTVEDTPQTSTQQQQQADTSNTDQRDTIVDLPMATAPVSPTRRQALPMPKRQQPDEITHGSEPKQQRTSEQHQALQRPQTQEPPTTRMRINAVTVTTKRGETITTTSCEDEQETETEKILLEPMVHNTDGLDKKKTTEGMKHEIEQMKKQGVYTEVNINDLTPEQQATIIESRWVLRDKGDKVRARIVAKGYTEQIEDADTIYASTPIFCILRILLTIAMTRQWTIKAGDISVAFLHANAATKDLFMWPPQEFYNNTWQTVWRLHKAMYGLRSSPSAWQNHLAQILQDLNMTRLKSEPNVYKTNNGTAYILVYVDDLLFIGQDDIVNNLFTAIQKQLMLRPTGELSMEQTISFLGRDITNKGDHYKINLNKSYITTMLEEAGMTTCKAATTPGTAANKTSNDVNDNIPVDKDEHALYRRIVGKLQWMTYTRPDLSFATKELARSLQQPTYLDMKKMKHTLRYLQGTKDYKFILHPTTIPQNKDIPILDVYVDADWAGCTTTRKSTTGFAIKYLGATIHFGSRTQAIVALASAESELYAIGTGAQESLHIRNFLMETILTSKLQIKIHTDSTSGKSIATRIGSSKKAKHIDLKYLFIQQLVHNGILTVHKIGTLDNIADIFTKYVTAETLNKHLYNVGLLSPNNN